MSRPLEKYHLTIRLRTLILMAAAATLVAYLARQGLSIRNYYRNGPASEKILKPLIDYHKVMRDDQQKRVQNQREMADRLARDAVQEFRAVAWSTWVAVICPERPRPGLDTGWGLVRSHLHESGLLLGYVRDRLRDASCHERMEKYHGRMRDYYRRLLEAHVVELPPLPAEELAELRDAEAQLRRVYGDRFTLLEPPPHLMPKAPKPNRRSSAPPKSLSAEVY